MIASPLRVLHLFANYKWTGPADPAMRCAVWQRRAGNDVVFAQAAWTLPGAEHRMARELWNAHLPVVAGLELRKHFHPVSVLADAKRLAHRLRIDRFDVVHTHLLADHLIAALALRRLGNARPLLLRSFYDEALPRRGWRSWLAMRETDGVIVPTAEQASRLASRLGIATRRVLVQDPPVESARARLVGDLRTKLGVSRDEFLVGITARIQPHRRFDLCFDVLARVVESAPNVRLVLLGRGNARHTEEHVLEPIRRRGLESRVLLPGYLFEPEYSLALRSLDAFLFLVPGSDGTCRALREATALGIPAVATRRGFIPFLLGAHPDLSALGPCGLAVDESTDALAQALLRVVRDPDLRAALATAGRARALGPAEPARAAARLDAFIVELRAARRSASA